MQLTKTDIWAIRDALYIAQINRHYTTRDPERIKQLYQAQQDLFLLLEEEIRNTSPDDTWSLEQN